MKGSIHNKYNVGIVQPNSPEHSLLAGATVPKYHVLAHNSYWLEHLTSKLTKPNKAGPYTIALTRKLFISYILLSTFSHKRTYTM